MEAVNGVSEGDKGGPPPPSPLTGCYLLIVIGEPHCNEHKDIILQRVAKGLLSWDVNDCLVDLEKELAIITEQALEGEEARYGERLIQFASENLVTEILIHPVVSTLAQCVRNLLSSFTRHRHIIHAGYTFANNGSWVLQDGTFSSTDFSEAFQEIEVLRVIRAYENGISLHLHCAPEGDWTRLPKESFTKGCKVRVNSNDVLTAGSPAISSFINYLEPFLVSAELESVLESSDVVGNIRFSRPTLYVFPGGQGDAALFGINGFNMLLDGGFSRKACFWDFVRHLDRLDAVLLTRLNNSNVNGISAVLKRKKQNALYPQIGHFFCNIQERKAILSPDGDKDKDPLLINLLEEGQDIVSNLRHLSLIPQVCYRDSEPINLYHKVGHGTLDMYVLSPAKDSKEVREFLQKWNNNDQKLFANPRTNKEFAFPLQNLVSVCALLVWQPANPEDTITRILFPGSSPQNKIFEGLDKVKNLDFIKHPVCSEKSLAPTTIIKAKQSVIDRLIQPERKILDNKKDKVQKPPPETNDAEIKNGEVNGVQPEKATAVKKSDSTESDKSISKPKKIVENGDKVAKPKPRPEPRTKPRSDSQQRKVKAPEKKPSPTTPKKQVDKLSDDSLKPKVKPSPTSTPAKSTKEANNRKVVESKIKSAPPKKEAPKPAPEKKEVKVERKPISRRPKDISKLTGSPKKVNGVQKPDSISKRGKLDKEGTTDSSTVSTPSAEQDSILKKDISKLTSDEIQNLKAQELADLKEEQEAVKEIEAVFRKGELHQDKPSDFRKIKDISIDDKLESEEYLIIEKTEIEQDLVNETNKEEETQKIARDSEESEKQRKPSEEKEPEVEEKQKPEFQEEVQKVTTSTDIVKAKEETTVEASKEVSATSPEDKIDVSDKKDIEEIKEIAQESQPDEKGSANIESGATTTAPTLPEDERMPLDEIKEDNGDQIEEKHVKEDTKEKDVPVIQLPPKTFDNIAKLPPVVGIRLDKQPHMRDIVKTPDEVADLPMHEEVEFDHYDEYPSATETKSEPEEGKKDDVEKGKVEEKVSKEAETAVDKEKTEVGVKKEEISIETKKTSPEPEVKAVIPEDLNKKELSKSPDEEKDTDEHELEQQKGETKEIKSSQDEIVKNKETSEKVEAKEILKIQQEAAADEKPKESGKESEEKVDKEPTKVEEVVEKSETEVKEKDEAKEKSPEPKQEELQEKEKIEELSQKLPEVPKHEIVKTEPKLKEDVSTIHKIDEQLQQLKEEIPKIPENESTKVEKDAIPPKKEETELKQDVTSIEKIEEKLQELKEHVEDQQIKAVSEIITHKVEEAQHAEPVIITTDSAPESPDVDYRKFDDKMELGRKSPKEREEDVAKIVASVAEVLKSDAPLEEFEGKIPFTIPYKSFTTELRETHITTVESPVTEEDRIAQAMEQNMCPKILSSYLIEEERKIAPIHEEPEVSETKISKMIKDSNDLMQATSKMIYDIKTQPKTDTIVEEPAKEEQDADNGTVHRMLVTASSEDGGEEIEICPPGTITFSRSSESSGRSSPDPQSQKVSQRSSLADTFSDGTVISRSVIKDQTGTTVESSIKDEPVIEKAVCDNKNLVDNLDKKVDTKEQISDVKDEKKVEEPVQSNEKIEPSETGIKKEVAPAKTEDKPVDAAPKTEEQTKDILKEIESQIEEAKTDAKKQEVIENAADTVLGAAAETIKEAKQEAEQKLETVAKEAEQEKSFLGGLVNDIGASLLDDTTKLIEEAQQQVNEMKENAKAKIEGLKDEITTKKDEIENAVVDLKETITKDEKVVESSKTLAEEVKESATKEKEKLVEIVKDFEKSVVKEAESVTETVKSEIASTKEIVEEQVKNVQEILSTQKQVVTGVIGDVKDAITKDVEKKVEEIKQEVEETKETAKTKVEEVCKLTTEKVEATSEKTKEIVAVGKKELEEVKDKTKDEAGALLKDIAEKEETMIKTISEQTKQAEKNFEEKKEQVVEKLESLSKELTEAENTLKETVDSTVSEISSVKKDLTEATKSDTTIEHKYDLFNGLESVEKMVVDVLTADREETSSKSGEKSEAKKTDTEDESFVGKGLSEVKEFVEETKQAITSIFKDDTSKEEVLEKSAHDIEENFEIVSDMAKSVIFEKCDKTTEEELEKQEKKLEKSAQSLEEDYEIVNDMAKSIVFDKCETLTEQQKEEKVLEKSAHDIEDNFEIVSDMAKSMVFEKCDQTTEKEHEKQEKKLEKSAQSLEEDYETVADMAKSIVFDKCEKLTEEQKEEKVLEKSAHDIEDNYKILSDMTQSVVFEKCEEPLNEIQKEEKVLEKVGKEDNYKAKSDMTQSAMFEKSEASLKEDAKPGKSSPEKLETKDAHEDLACRLSGKSSPALSSELKDLAKEGSGKSTPTDHIKVDNQDSLLSGKSSPGLSGKSSPILSGRSSPGVKAESKDSLLSGKSTPDHTKPDSKMSSLSGKSSPALSDEKDEKLQAETKDKSAKSSPAVSGKSTPAVLNEKQDKKPDDSGKASPTPISDLKPENLDAKTGSAKSTPASSGKTTPIPPGDLKQEKKEKDASPGSSPKSSPEKKGSKSAKSSAASSGKTSPVPAGDGKEKKKDKSSAKSSPAGSPKSSPTKEKKKGKDGSKSKEASAKSSPAGSGKSSPLEVSDLKEKAKDTSSKSSPNASGKSTPVQPEKKEAESLQTKPSPVGSGKASPVPPSDVKETEILPTKEASAKSSPAESGKASPTPPGDKKTNIESKDASAKSSSVGSGKASPALIGDIKTTEEAKSTINQEQKDAVSAVELTKKDDKSEKDVSAKAPDIPADITVASQEKKTEEKLTKTLDVQESKEKKLSISDVEISLKTIDKSTSDLTKSLSPEDTKPADDKAENKELDSIDSGIGTEVESRTKKEELDKITKDVKIDKEKSIAGPSVTLPEPSLTPARASNEDLHLSGKSTPDIAEVEKIKEREKHILGSSTPPTVPVSPIIKDSSSTQAEETKPSSSAPIKSSVASLKDNDLRSCTPGSDDYEIGASTHSDISSGQASRAPHLFESERAESDDDEDVPGSPLSVTSQVAHSRSSSRYDFEDERIGTKMDPMNTSFYGALPDEEDTELDFEKALAEHRQTRGEDLVTAEDSPSYLYEVTTAKYSARTPEPEEVSGQSQLDQINKNEANLMTASFIGDLPSSTTTKDAKDVMDSWGKPLGLPSPAPPNDNRGTPKKERKLPSNVTAKNKLNERRAESPSKYKNKKFSPVYVDLTYVPHHGNSYYSYVDFFKRVRARYYVFSGIEPSREVYNALLEAKQTWEDKELEVTIIPTYDTDILGYWVAENEELLTKYKIDLSPSASRCTINLQDHETSCSAYRLEF